MRAAELSRPGPTPTRQHTAACRAAQLARRQPALDRIDINLYRDHCASKRAQTALPQTPARDTGRAVAYNDVITVPPRHHKDQTQIRPADELLTVSAASLPPVLNLNAPEHLLWIILFPLLYLVR